MISTLGKLKTQLEQFNDIMNDLAYSVGLNEDEVKSIKSIREKLCNEINSQI